MLLNKFESEIEKTTSIEYAENILSVIIQVINKTNKEGLFHLKPNSVIILPSSEQLSIDLALSLNNLRNNLRIKNIYLDDPAANYEQHKSENIQKVIKENEYIKLLTSEILHDSYTYEDSIIIMGATYAGCDFSKYNTNSISLLVSCEDNELKNHDSFLYSVSDFHRAPNSFCSNKMYMTLEIKLKQSNQV
jgi:hypothetical protein